MILSAVEPGLRTRGLSERARPRFAVARLGRSLVRYQLGIFRRDGALTVARGHFVHVYVDRATQRPVAIPEPTRSALKELLSDGR